MKVKKLISLLLAVTLSLGLLCACGARKDDTAINLGVFQGPTGIGAAYLIDQAKNNQSLNKYSITTAQNATDLAAQITSGTLDIAAMPTNVAANLYNKTNGEIQIVALNTLGVLYILENGNSVNSISDLRGKTIYATGQGAVPEYTLNFLLEQANLKPGEDVTVTYLDTNEAAAKAAAGDIDLCMLPVPFATTVLEKNHDIRQAIDLTQEWNNTVGDSGNIVTGCIVARRDFIENNKAKLNTFLDEYHESVGHIITADDAAQLVVECGIVSDESIAEKAIEKSNIVCITGSDMKPAINGFFEVLFNANPASIGGKMPDDGIYYEN